MDKVSVRQGVALQAGALAASRPEVLARIEAGGLAPLREGSVAMVGIGASLYAAVAGAAQLRAQGRRAVALPGTDLLDAGVEVADHYVALSASGRSVEPARAMALRPGAFRLGIAKAVEVPLRGAVTSMIGTGTGPDSSPNTTSYTGSLQALGLLADHVGRPSGFDWAGLPGQVEEVAATVAPAVSRAAALLAGRPVIDCVGAGVASGTAGYAALLLREAVRVAAQPWDTLNFLHGPMEPQDGRTGVVLFGDGREVLLARDLAGFKVATVLVTARPDVEGADHLVIVPVPGLGHGLAEAVLQAVPVQLLTASLMEAAGLPVCEFRYRQTDTKTDTVPAVA